MKPQLPFFRSSMTSLFLAMGLGWIFWQRDIVFGGVLTGIGIVFLFLTAASLIRQRRNSRTDRS